MKDRLITCTHSRKDKKFTFTPYNSFTHKGFKHAMVCFKHNNINSMHAFQDSTWISYKIKPKNINELEQLLGLSIIAWE